MNDMEGERPTDWLSSAGVLGLSLSTFAARPASEIRQLVGAVEGLGCGSVWHGESTAREAFSISGLLLSATSRMFVATGIANIYARDPSAAAFGAMALDEAWAGRFVLGLGVSHSEVLRARGHSELSPLVAMHRYLDDVDAAVGRWSGPPAPRPKVVLAALRGRMVELAAERTLGAHPYLVPVHHTELARRVLGDGAVLAPVVPVVVASDRDDAKRRGRWHLEKMLQFSNYSRNLRSLGYAAEDLVDGGTDAVFDDLVAWGDAGKVADRVREHLAAGASQVVLNPVGGGGVDDVVLTFEAVAEQLSRR